MHQCVKHFMENLHPHILLFPGFFFYRMFQSLGGGKKNKKTKKQKTQHKNLTLAALWTGLKILKRYIPRQFKLGETCPSISAFTFLPNQAEKPSLGNWELQVTPSRFHSFNTCCGTVLCPYYPGDRFLPLNALFSERIKRGRLLTKRIIVFLNRSF